MFTIPNLMALPVFGGFAAGTSLLWPIGVVLGWMLVAALVGSFLGMLREYDETTDPGTERLPGAQLKDHLPDVSDHSHQKAA